MKLSSMIAVLVLATSAAYSQGSIQAPLSPEQMEFVNQRAPILIQPDFENQTDNLIAFDYDTQMSAADGKSFGSIGTKDNFDDRARKAITFEIAQDKGAAVSNVRAMVDWDFIEVGGAVSLNFLFHRPLSKGGWSDRRIDSESAVLAFKKKSIGQNLDFVQMIGWTNAHGAPLFGACDANTAKCLGPNFVNNVSVEDFISEQASGNGRVIKRIGGREGQVDGRALIVSEHYTHALSFVTDIDALKKAIDLKGTVIYYPKGAEEIDELRKIFNGAIFVSYELRNKEFSSIIKDNIAKVAQGKADPILITQGGETNPKAPKAVKSFWKHDVQIMGIPSEFVGSNGKASGANPYSAWGVTTLVDKQGKRGTPKEFKDSNFTRINCPQLGSILVNCTTDFFSAEEIEQGADLFIRNNFMSDIGPVPQAPKHEEKEVKKAEPKKAEPKKEAPAAKKNSKK